MKPNSMRVLHQLLRSWKDSSSWPKEIWVYVDLLLPDSEVSANQGEEFRKFLADVLKEVESVDPIGKNILYDRFINDYSIVKTAHKNGFSTDQINRRQKKALRTFAALFDQRVAGSRQNNSKEFNIDLLSINPQSVFGFSEDVEKLWQLLQEPASPKIIALVGLGGIGKTTMANLLARKNESDFAFYRIVWLRIDSFMSGKMFAQSDWDIFLDQIGKKLLGENAKREDAKELTLQLLHSKEVIVVIDNIGSEDDLSQFYRCIGDFGGKTKFVLTSRKHPGVNSGIYVHQLKELDLTTARKLLLFHANQINLAIEIWELEEKAEIIYRVVGGNPLALKLVVGLLGIYPLQVVLDEFESVKIKNIEEMYTYIYWKIWEGLNANCRQLLQAMPLVSENGGGIEQLKAISNLEGEDLLKALQYLMERFLIERRGSLDALRYAIHQLTESFLLSEISGWKVAE